MPRTKRVCCPRNALLVGRQCATSARWFRTPLRTLPPRAASIAAFGAVVTMSAASGLDRGAASPPQPACWRYRRLSPSCAFQGGGPTRTEERTRCFLPPYEDGRPIANPSKFSDIRRSAAACLDARISGRKPETSQDNLTSLCMLAHPALCSSKRFEPVSRSS